MTRYAYILLFGMVAGVSAQTLVTPEAHFFGIPNADSLSFDWFMGISDSADYGPFAPEDLDVLRLSPNDYRMVMLDGSHGVFLQFRLDQHSPLELHDLVHSGTGPDTTCSTRAMCLMQQGAYFNPSTARIFDWITIRP